MHRHGGLSAEDAATPPSVVAVVGSPRRHGNTAALAGAVVDELTALGAACESILLGDLVVAPCLAHDGCAEFPRCPLEDDAAAVLERVFAADCVILASPVYYENVSAQMKALMDRSLIRYSHDERLRARAVGVIAVAAETGLQETIEALRRYVALSAKRDVPVFSCGGYADAAGTAMADAELVGRARLLAAQLAGELGLSRA